MGWIVGVLLPLGLAGGVISLRWNATRLTRTIEVPSGQPTAAFRGSFWSLPAGGTKGYWAKLEFFDWGIRVRGSKPGGFLLPVFEVRYTELTDARLVAARGRQGIRFRSDALPAPVTFETFADSIPRIVSLLEDWDVPINRETGHIGWLPGD